MTLKLKTVKDKNYYEKWTALWGIVTSLLL
jgi:hypothetical protein